MTGIVMPERRNRAANRRTVRPLDVVGRVNALGVGACMAGRWLGSVLQRGEHEACEGERIRSRCTWRRSRENGNTMIHAKIFDLFRRHGNRRSYERERVDVLRPCTPLAHARSYDDFPISSPLAGARSYHSPAFPASEFAFFFR